MYPDPQVAAFVMNNFIPVRVHVKRNSEEYQRLSARFNAQWTPTVLIVDRDGNERHRIEGFLPTDDFVPQLILGAGHAAFGRGAFGDAERRFREAIDAYPDSDAAPEAQYWAGVSRYKATSDPAALTDTARAFSARYQESPWAKKASVWKK